MHIVLDVEVATSSCKQITSSSLAVSYFLSVLYAWECSETIFFANFANDVTFANIYFANISHLCISYSTEIHSIIPLVSHCTFGESGQRQ